MQATGGAGHVQTAIPPLTWQGLPTGQVVEVACWQPLASAVQVTTSLPEQWEPLAWPGPEQALTVGQVQSALPASPPQGLPVGQVLFGAAARQPCVSREHVTTDVLDSQKVPVVLAQIDGDGGQLQLAEGKEPVQGFSAGHTVGAAR
jgi:hypothetical protein